MNIIEVLRFNEKPIVHKLSHQHLHTTFWVVDVIATGTKGTPLATIRDFPVPILIGRFLEEFLPQ